MPYLHISLFGSFTVTLADQPLEKLSTDKVRALLAYLAIEANYPHSRSQLAGLLWPDVSEKQARQSLRSALYRLRQALDWGGSAPSLSEKASDQLLTITRQTVTLHKSGSVFSLTCDVDEFRTRLAAVHDHSHDKLTNCPMCIAALEEAATLYRGDLLAGFGLADAPEFEEWLLLQREMLHQQALLLFERLAVTTEEKGDYEKAAGFATRLLTLDSYRETSHRLVMRLLALRDLPDQALAQYANCRQLMMDEFGAEPEAETVALAEQIRRGEIQGSKREDERSFESPTTSKSGNLTTPQHDWREMPIENVFFGRRAEAQQLERWLVEDRCRLVSILAIGGMGKTSLAAHVVPAIAEHFDLIIWRSLLNAPPLAELISTLLSPLSNQQIINLPESIDQQLQLLFEQMQTQRVLLVLDNLESILQADVAGQYRVGYESYEQLLRGMATHQHQGQLLLTSRERPSKVRMLERDSSLVCSLYLLGLDTTASERLLVSRGLSGGTGNEAVLVERYSGNPLALKLVADTVQDLFLGDVDEFLAEDSLIFDDVRRVLDQHFARLTDLEQEILFWLALEREALNPQTLRVKLLNPPPGRMLLEAINNLQRRSLVERHPNGFGLQNVIVEYLTDRFVEEAVVELQSCSLTRLISHAVLNVQSQEHVRQSQVRLIVRPIGSRFFANKKSSVSENPFKPHLDALRTAGANNAGYAGGNLLNLLLEMRDGQLDASSANYNFSALPIRQAFLRGKLLQGVNLAGANLADSVCTETFGSILCLAVQPKGPLLAAGTFLGPIYLYGVEKGEALGVLRHHEELVFGVAFSRDGRRLASASADGTVAIWDLSPFFDPKMTIQFDLLRPTQVLHGHEGWVHAVAFAPDGTLVASGGVDQTVRLWDLDSGTERHILGGDGGRVYSVAFSEDGVTLASGSADRKIHLWDVEAGDHQGALTYATERAGGTFGVHAISFSPDGRTLATCSPENSIYLWDTSELNAGRAKVRHICRSHSDWIGSLAFNPDGKLLASAGFDGSVRLWDIASATERYVLTGHTNQLNAVVFSSDGRVVISGGADETIRFWDVDSGRSRQILQGHTNHTAGVAFHPKGQAFATANADNAVRLWQIAADQAEARPIPKRLQGHTKMVMAVVFHPDGEWLASGGHDHTICVWDYERAELMHQLTAHTNCVRSLAFSPDGQTLVSGSYDLTARIWDVQSRQVRHTLGGHKDWILSLAISPDGKTLATASDTVRLWDMKSGSLLRTLPDQSSIVYDVTYSPNGQLLVAGYLDQTVRVWDTQSGQELNKLYGLDGFVNFVNFSPDGQTLISGDAGHYLYLWPLLEGEQRIGDPITLPHVSISAIKIAFSPDSRILISGGDETIELWDVKTGENFQTLRLPGPYQGTNITGIQGISDMQKAAFKTLGAIEECSGQAHRSLEKGAFR